MKPIEQRLPNDDLTRFLRWYLAERPVTQGQVRMIGPITGMTLYRAEQFQVQMFAGTEGLIIPEHSHPNVDSYEVNCGGNLRFSKHGRWPRAPQVAGGVIRIRPGVLHGGYSGPGGGIFMSVQHWLNGVAPTCVTEDYDGPALNEQHHASVPATVLRPLTLRDAASKESA